MRWWVAILIVWAVVNGAYIGYCLLKGRMRRGMRYNEWTDEWERDDETN